MDDKQKKSAYLSCSRGMTLLEMLMVVAILSSVAWVAMGTVSNNTGQIRYEDTRNRLGVIREAILGSTRVATWERGIQGGYVVDNGLLPLNIDALVTLPNTSSPPVPATAYDVFGVVTPQFDPTPTPGGINDGSVDEITLPLPRQQLQKGHRGFYMTGSVNNMYRDGWGTDRAMGGVAAMDCPLSVANITGYVAGANEGNDVDVENHGWCVTVDGATHSQKAMYIDSYGLDGQSGAVTGDPYEQDFASTEPIFSDDWQTDVTGATIHINNLTGADIDLTALGISLRVSLLVYFNDADRTTENNWQRITTGNVSDSCIEGGPDVTCPVGAPQVTIATFPAAIPPANNSIPVGEHVLILVANNGTGDTVDLSTIAGWPGQRFADTRVKYFSRAGVPEMVIEIR